MDNIIENSSVSTYLDQLFIIAKNTPFSNKRIPGNQGKINIALKLIDFEFKKFLTTELLISDQLLIKERISKSKLAPKELLHLIKICETCRPYFSLFAPNLHLAWRLIRKYAFRYYFQKTRELKRVQLVEIFRQCIFCFHRRLSNRDLFNFCIAFDKRHAEKYLYDRFIQNAYMSLNHIEQCSLVNVHRYFPKLRSLTLNTKHLNKQATLYNLSSTLKFSCLQRLSLIEMERTTPAYTSDFFKITPSLRALHLTSSLCPIERLRYANKLHTQIATLYLMHTPLVNTSIDSTVQKSDLSILDLFTNLQTLSLTHIHSKEYHYLLPHITCLKKLTLNQLQETQLNALSVLFISQNRELRKISLLGKLKCITFLDPSIANLFSQARPHLRKLQLLNLFIDDITLSALLKNIENLRHLDLQQGCYLGIESLKNLMKLKNLKKLTIGDSDTLNNHTLVSVLLNNKQLRSLNIFHSPYAVFEKADYEKIQKHSLKTLRINHDDFFTQTTFAQFAQCFGEIEELDFPAQNRLNNEELFKSIILMKKITRTTLLTLTDVSDEIALLAGENLKHLKAITQNKFSFTAIQWYRDHKIEVSLR